MTKSGLLALSGIFLIGASANLFAQSCTSPTPVNANNGINGANLCDSTNFVTKYCAFNNNPSPDYAFSITPAAGFTATGVTLTNTSGNWTPEIILQQTCGSTTDCTASAAIGASNGNSGTLNFSDASTTVAAGTTYYLLVSSFGANNCPTAETFNLAPAGGTLPVTLKSFKVN